MRIFLMLFLALGFCLGREEIATAEIDVSVPILQKSAITLGIQRQFIGSEVSINRIRYSPDGQLLLTAAADGTGTLWTREGKMLAQLKGQKPPMFNARFSPDGQTIITTGYDGTIHLWNLQGELLHTYQPHQAAVADAVFSPDGQTVVTCSDDGQTQIFTRQGKRLGGIIQRGTSRNLAYDPKGMLIASVSDSGSLYLINPNGELQKEIATGQGRINSISFSPDGQQLLTAGTNSSAKLWDLDGKLISEVKIPAGGWVNSAQFHPKDQWIATASDDGTLRLWQRDGKLFYELPLGTAKLTSLGFSPDGKHLAATSSQGQVWVFNISN